MGAVGRSTGSVGRRATRPLRAAWALGVLASLLALLLFPIGARPAYAQTPTPTISASDPYEPNSNLDFSNATVITGSVYNARISADSDFDFFQISLSSGATLQLTLSLSGDTASTDDDIPFGMYLDLYDPAGQQIPEASTEVAARGSGTTNYTVVGSGTHYIGVSCNVTLHVG